MGWALLKLIKKFCISLLLPSHVIGLAALLWAKFWSIFYPTFADEVVKPIIKKGRQPSVHRCVDGCLSRQNSYWIVCDISFPLPGWINISVLRRNCWRSLTFSNPSELIHSWRAEGTARVMEVSSGRCRGRRSWTWSAVELQGGLAQRDTYSCKMTS